MDDKPTYEQLEKRVRQLERLVSQFQSNQAGNANSSLSDNRSDLLIQDECKIELAEIVDAQAIQLLMDDFYDLTHIGIAILDLNGNILVAKGWQDICVKFHRTHPLTAKNCLESDLELSNGIEPGAFQLYRCKNNMLDMATPIMVGNQKIGNLYLGQFLFDDEPVDVGAFRLQAKTYGFDEDRYIAALKQVPRWSKTTVNTVMRFYTKFANLISDLSYKNYQLKQSENKYRSLVENLNDVIFTISTEYIITYVSPPIKAILGYGPSELIGRDFREFIHQNERGHLIAVFENILKGKLETSEYRVRAKDGNYRWVRSSSRPIKNENNIDGLQGVLTDVHAQKQAERQLAESLSWYLAIFDGSKDAIFISDEQSRFTHINQAAVELTGYRKDELISMKIPDLHDHIDLDAYHRYHSKIMAGADITSEAKILRKDKSKVDTQFSNKRIIIDGKHYMHTVARDISEMNKIHSQIQDLNERFELAADSAGIGVWDLDLKQNTLIWDNWMYKLYGVDAQAFEGAYEAWQKGVHPDDLGLVDKEVQDAIDGVKDFDTHFRIVRPDGAIRYIKANARIMKDANGEPCRMIGVNYDITPQKRSEVAFRQSEEKFREIIESARDIHCRQHFDTLKLDYISRSVTSILGYHVEEMMRMDFTQHQGLFHPEDWPKLRNFREELFAADQKGQKHIEREFRMLDKSGAVRWICGTYFLTRDPDGRPLFIVGNLRDMTRRKHAQQQLRFQSRILDQIKDVITVTDLDGNITYVNQAAKKMLGKSNREIVGQNVAIFGEDVEYGANQADILDQTLQNGSWSGQIVNYHADGTPIIVSLRTQTVNDQNGHIMALCGIGTDITAQKQIENSIKENEKRYQTILKAAIDGFAIFDSQGKIIEINEAFCRMTGYTESDLLALKIVDIQAVETPRRPDDYLARIIQNGYDRFESRLFRKDGSICEVDISVQHMEIGDGQFIAFYKDISARKQYEARMQQADKMEALGTLAGGIAHDFNNILFPMLGYAEMLKDDIAPDSTLHNHVHQIFQAAIRAKDLVQQILIFSRQGEQRRAVLTVQPIIKEALKLLRRTIPTSIDIKSAIDPSCGAVIADPTQIHQIIMNLVTNSYHALQDAGGEIYVSLEQANIESLQTRHPELMPGQYLLLKIADTGSGIDKSIINKIFDPYYTTKEKGKGTGLGLSIVQGIVKSCNGNVFIASKVGKGTTVSVYLPIAEKEKTTVQNETEIIQGGTEKILLVDDEIAILKMLKQMLERLGYCVTTCTSSIEALKQFQASPHYFDIVITDMAMPNMTGVQLSTALRSIRHNIPIILCTGYSEKIDQEKCNALGIQGYVMKPVVRKDAADMIRKVMDQALTEQHNLSNACE